MKQSTVSLAQEDILIDNNSLNTDTVFLRQITELVPAWVYFELDVLQMTFKIDFTSLSLRTDLVICRSRNVKTSCKM